MYTYPFRYPLPNAHPTTHPTAHPHAYPTAHPYPYPCCTNGNGPAFPHVQGNFVFNDAGTRPFVVNINQAAKQNNTFRTALWTGKHLQVTLMSINVGEDIGLEVHPTVEQFLRIESGQGIVLMGDTKENLNFQSRVYDDDAIMVPAGKWHNVINTGYTPLKLYTIYAPPEHPFGTVHPTKADAMAVE